MATTPLDLSPAVLFAAAMRAAVRYGVLYPSYESASGAEYAIVVTALRLALWNYPEGGEPALQAARFHLPDIRLVRFLDQIVADEQQRDRMRRVPPDPWLDADLVGESYLRDALATYLSFPRLTAERLALAALGAPDNTRCGCPARLSVFVGLGKHPGDPDAALAHAWTEAGESRSLIRRLEWIQFSANHAGIEVLRRRARRRH